MNYLVIQYDNRLLDVNASCLISINKKYCQLHNYDYIFISQEYDLPPYWIKVKLVQEYLLLNKYKGVMWLDTDACIYNNNIKLEDIIIENKSFFLSPDNKIWAGPFCAGVFIVLNDDNGNTIINEWMDLYNKNNWNNNNNKWDTSCCWAGSDYEQGSFCENLLYKYKNNIHSFDWYFFNSSYSNISEYNKKIFILHFASHFKNEIPQYIKEYINDIHP